MGRHRIDFRQINVIVMQMGSPGVPPQVLVSWEIDPIRSNADQVAFHVERSQSPSFDDTDAIETISPAIPAVANQAVYEYLDITVNLQSFWRDYFYRIKTTDTDPQRTIYSDAFTWESSLKVFEEDIVARNDWLLRYETGTPCFALVARTAGSDHCQYCWNPSLKRTNKSNCSYCYGTGRERPFFQPILTFIDFNPPAKFVQVAPVEKQPSQVDVWLSAYPKVKPNDVFVEVLSGNRWRVVQIHPIGDVRTTIMQFIRLDRVNRAGIENKVAIPADTQRQAVNDLEAMKRERRF